MRKKLTVILCGVALFLSLHSACNADEIFSLRIFFGLSLPGGGAVSLDEWQSFQQGEIAKAFDGFNVVDSVGFYKGKSENSKVVTIILEEKDIPKARRVAALYAGRFKQDSVMIVKVPVLEWDFIGAEDKTEADRVNGAPTSQVPVMVK